MQPDVTGSNTPGDAERRAKVAAAARVLRSWIKARDPEVSSAGPGVPVFPAPAQIQARPTIQNPVASPAAAAPVAAAPSLASETVADGRLSPADLPRMPTWHWPALPAIPWSRNASIATGAFLVLLVALWMIVANRSGIADAWSSMVSAGSEAMTPATTGTLVLHSVPDAAQVAIAGEELGTTPLTTELPAGRHAVVFRRGGEVREVEIDVVAGQSVEGRVDWAARPTGHLRVDSMPPGATVVIEGRERGVTPVIVEALPAGTYTILLRGTAGTVERRVTVTAGRTTEVTEAIYSGFVHVSAPFELIISRNGQRLRLDEQNQLLLPPGRHRLRFENVALAFSEERQIEVTPGETTRLAIVPDATTLTVTATQPSEVFLNGARIGETSLVRHPLPIGTHQITVRSLATGVERQSTLTATSAPVNLDVDFSLP